MPAGRINPTLFDKLTAGLGAPAGEQAALERPGAAGGFRFYTVPQVERFNERALRATVLRELGWLFNTTAFESSVDLKAYPEVRTSVLNYGLRDLSGQSVTRRGLQERGRQIAEAIRAFEPRLDSRTLEVENVRESGKDNAITYLIRGDITAAVEAMPVEFKTEIELDTATATVRD